MSVGIRKKERQRSMEIEKKTKTKRYAQRETQRQREIKGWEVYISQYNIIFQCCAQLHSKKTRDVHNPGFFG